jgi:hypothetical protein
MTLTEAGRRMLGDARAEHGLISQIRIRSAGKGFSNAFKSPSSVSPNHFGVSFSGSISGMRV